MNAKEKRINNERAKLLLEIADALDEYTPRPLLIDNDKAQVYATDALRNLAESMTTPALAKVVP